MASKSMRFEECVDFESDSGSETDDSSSEEEIQPIRKSAVKQRAEIKKELPPPPPPQVNGTESSDKEHIVSKKTSSSKTPKENGVLNGEGGNRTDDRGSVDPKSDSSAIEAGDESDGEDRTKKTKQKQKQLTKHGVEAKNKIRGSSFDSESDYEIRRHRTMKQNNSKNVVDSGTSGHGEVGYDEALPSSDGPDIAIDPSGRIVLKGELEQGNAASSGISISDVHCEEHVNAEAGALLPRDQAVPKVLEMFCTTENFGESTSKIETYASKLVEGPPGEDGTVKRDYEETALKAMIEKGDEGDEISATSQMRYRERETLTKTDEGVSVAEVTTNSEEVHETTTRSLEQVGDQRYVAAKTNRRSSASSSKKVFDAESFTQFQTGGVLKLALDSGGSREQMAAAALDQLTSAGSVNEGSKISITVAGTMGNDSKQQSEAEVASGTDERADSKSAVISGETSSAAYSSDTSTSEPSGLSSSLATSEDNSSIKDATGPSSVTNAAAAATDAKVKQAREMEGWEELTAVSRNASGECESSAPYNAGIPVTVVRADSSHDSVADSLSEAASMHEKHTKSDIVNNSSSAETGMDADAAQIPVPVFIDAGNKQSSQNTDTVAGTLQDQHESATKAAYSNDLGQGDQLVGGERPDSDTKSSPSAANTTEEAQYSPGRRAHNLTSRDIGGKMDQDINENGEILPGDESAAGARNRFDLSRGEQVSSRFSKRLEDREEESSTCSDYTEERYDRAKQRAVGNRRKDMYNSNFSSTRRDADDLVQRILSESSGRAGQGGNVSGPGNRYRINMDGRAASEGYMDADDSLDRMNGEPSLLERRMASMGGRPSERQGREGEEQGGYRPKYLYNNDEEEDDENDTGYRSKYICGPVYDPEQEQTGAAGGYRPRYHGADDADSVSSGRYGRRAIPNYDEIAETQSMASFGSAGDSVGAPPRNFRGGEARGDQYGMRRQKAVYGEEEDSIDGDYGYRPTLARRNTAPPGSYGYDDYGYDDEDDDPFYTPPPAEPVLPDEDFEPQRREETSEIVEERTKGIKGVVDRQNNVLEKLRKASVSFDDMDKEIRELKQQCIENQTRRECLLDELLNDPAVLDDQPEDEPMNGAAAYRSRYGAGSLQRAGTVGGMYGGASRAGGARGYGARDRPLGSAASFDYGFIPLPRRESTIDRELESDKISSGKALGNLVSRSYTGSSSRKSQFDQSETDSMYDTENISSSSRSPYLQRKYRTKSLYDDYADSGLGTESTTSAADRGHSGLTDDDASDTSSVRSYSRGSAAGILSTGEYGSASRRSNGTSYRLNRYGRSGRTMSDACVSLDSYRMGGSMSNLSTASSSRDTGFSSRFLNKVREKRGAGESTVSETRDKPFKSRFLKKSFDSSPSSSSSYSRSKSLGRSYSFSGGDRSSSYTRKSSSSKTADDSAANGSANGGAAATE